MSEHEPEVEEICGPGVDPHFDQLLWTLGNIARQKPKPLIDTIMYWRKSKGEQAQEAKIELNKVSTALKVYTSEASPANAVTDSVRYGVWHWHEWLFDSKLRK